MSSGLSNHFFWEGESIKMNNMQQLEADFLDQLEASIKELEDSFAEIMKRPIKTVHEAQVTLIDVQRERLRAMVCEAKSVTYINYSDCMSAKLQLNIKMKNLKNDRCSWSRSSSNKKKSNVINNESCPKKMKLAPEIKSVKQKTTFSSSRSNKENEKKVNPPKKRSSRTQEKVSEPEVPISTVNSVPSTAPKTLPSSQPLHNTNNNIWPVHTKKTIFLNNPPVRDSKVNNNVGYYSHAHAKKILGYVPEKLQVQTQGTGINCNSLPANSSNISINQQACQTQLKLAYNLSVSQGYNFNLVPGYVVQHRAQVHRSECSDVPNKKIESCNSSSTPKVGLSTNQTNVSDETGEGSNCNNNYTNELFRDLVCNKNNDDKEDDVNSTASMETLVITTKIATDFQELSQEY